MLSGNVFADRILDIRSIDLTGRDNRSKGRMALLDVLQLELEGEVGLLFNV